MTVVDVNKFTQKKICTFQGELYSVRNNGAVNRHTPDGKRARPNDNKWVFGKENSTNPYLQISGIRVHRIVCTAFHGEPPDPKYVVDHIDTNCRNNRPENLRWLSRLENALKNPMTRKKVEYLCGSIEAFLENPSMLNELQGNPNFKWMRTVTPEEAKNCKVRMHLWANSDSTPARTTGAISRKNSFGERVYKPLQRWEAGFGREPGLEMALTPWCAKYMWRHGAYFPCCPLSFGTDPLEDYFQNIKVGAVLANSEHDDNYPKLTVLEAEILKDKSSIIVMCRSTDSEWIIVGIELYEISTHFIHFVLGSFSSKGGVDKAYSQKKDFSDFWSDGYASAYGR